MDELRQSLREWSQRAKLQRSVALAFFGLACGLGVALMLALASRVFPIIDSSTLITVSISLALVGLAGALAYPWLQQARRAPMHWARRFDHEFGLKERISTALEVSEGDVSVPNDVVRKLQRSDADRIVQTVDAKALLPLSISRRDALVALGFLVLLVVAIALPNPQQQILAQHDAMRKTIEQQLQQLEQAQDTINKSTLTDAQKKLALEALNEARQKLQDPNVSAEQALAAINDAQSKLDAVNDQAAQQQADDLRQAGESLSPDEATNALASSLASQNFQQAADQLRNLAQSDNGQGLNQQQAERTASQLDQMARSVQNSDQALAQQLRNAAQSMREGNTNASQQSLDQAAKSLERAQQTAAASQTLNDAQSRADAARRAIADQATRNQASQPGQQAQNQNGADSSQGPGAKAGDTNAQQGQDGQPGAAMAGDAQNGQATGSSSSGVANGQPNGQSQKSDDVGTDHSIYAPQRINTSGKQVVLPDTQGQAAPNPNGRPQTAPNGSSSVPYEQVYRSYAKAADDAMQSGEVPADRRDYVRDYFSSLDPNQHSQQTGK